MTAIKLTTVLTLLVVAAPIVSYNRFVRGRALIRSSWASIGVELRRRYDLIPTLVETVKGYAAHERRTIEAVTAARERAAAPHSGAAEQGAYETALARAVGGVLAVAEAYPTLKADRHFLELQRELAITEDRIQTARRYYNANVTSYNTRVASFPSTVIASLFHFGEESLFEAEPAVREAAPATRFAAQGATAR